MIIKWMFVQLYTSDVKWMYFVERCLHVALEIIS